MATPQIIFDKFDPASEKWEFYKERLENYFKISKLDATMKSPMLVNCLDSETYKILRDICTPDLPILKTYDQLCEIMTQHFTKVIVVHKERRAFYSATRGTDEKLNMWLARIKSLSSNCKFGAQLEASLTDKYIGGLRGRAFDRVCEENETINLLKAHELALKYESDVSGSVEPAHSSELLFIAKPVVKPEENTYGYKKSDVSKSKIVCICCGRVGHIKPKCRFRTYSCSKCGEKGHLKAVCASKGGDQAKNNLFLSRDGDQYLDEEGHIQSDGFGNRAAQQSSSDNDKSRMFGIFN